MAVCRAATLALLLLVACAWSDAAAQAARPGAGAAAGAGPSGRPPAAIVFPPAGLKGPASIPRPVALNTGGPLSVRVEPRQPLGRATAALRGVAWRLQRLVGAADGAGNLLMSPLSVAAALGQLLLGARGETRALLADLLDAPGPTGSVPKVSLGGEVLIPDLEYHQQFKALLDLLAADDAPASSVELRIASAFFAQRGLPLRTDFQHALHDLYQADVRSLDFRERPAEAAAQVNEWARRATRGRIPTVLAQPLPASTAALVASAVYFRGAWASPFDPELTVTGWFRLNARRRVAAKFMRGHFSDVPYYDAPGLGYRLVVLPYKGGQTAMYVMLPEDKDVDLRTFASSMSLDGMMAAARAARPQTLTLILPRMNIAGSFSLKEPLSNLRRTRRRLRRTRRGVAAAPRPPPTAQVSVAAGPRDSSAPARDPSRALPNPAATPSQDLQGQRVPAQLEPHVLPDLGDFSRTGPKPERSSQALPSLHVVPGQRAPSEPQVPSRALPGLRQPSQAPAKHLASSPLPDENVSKQELHASLKSPSGHAVSSKASPESNASLNIRAALYNPSRSVPDPSLPSHALPITRVPSQSLRGLREPSRTLPEPGTASQPLSVSPEPSQPFQVSLAISGHESDEQTPVQGIVLEELAPIPVAKTSLNRPVIVGVPLRIMDEDESRGSSKRQSNFYYQAKASPSDTVALDSSQESHLLYPYRPTSTSFRKSSNEKPSKITFNAKDSQDSLIPKMVLGTQVNFPYDASLLSTGALKDPVLPSVSNLRKIRPALDANDRGNCTATADVSVSDSASPGSPTKLFANIFIKPSASVHTGPLKGREEEQDSTNHILIARSEPRARAVDSPATPSTLSAGSPNTTPSAELTPPSASTAPPSSSGPAPAMQSSGTSVVSQPSSPVGQLPPYNPAVGQSSPPSSSPAYNTSQADSPSSPSSVHFPSADQTLPSTSPPLPPYVSPIDQPPQPPSQETTLVGGAEPPPPPSGAPGVEMQMSEGDGAALNPLAVGSQGAFGVNRRPIAPDAFSDVDLDLTGASNQTLRVSDALHHVWLEVTETGTEAVAITTTLVDYSGAEQLMAVNRPFLVAIVHEPSEALLFWAAVNDPTGGAGIRTDVPHPASAGAAPPKPARFAR